MTELAVLLGFSGDTHGRLVGTVPLRRFVAPDTARPVEVTAESSSLAGVIAAARTGLGIAVLRSARWRNSSPARRGADRDPPPDRGAFPIGGHRKCLPTRPWFRP